MNNLHKTFHGCSPASFLQHFSVKTLGSDPLPHPQRFWDLVFFQVQKACGLKFLYYFCSRFIVTQSSWNFTLILSASFLQHFLIDDPGVWPPAPPPGILELSPFSGAKSKLLRCMFLYWWHLIVTQSSRNLSPGVGAWKDGLPGVGVGGVGGSAPSPHPPPKKKFFFFWFYISS